MRRHVLATVLSLIMTASPLAAASTITFEEPSGPTVMGNSPGAPVPVASRLSNQYLSTGVVFSSASGYAAVVDHGYPTLTPSAPNIIGGSLAGALSYATPITATFFVPSTTKGAVTNTVTVLGDLFGAGFGNATLTAYDRFGNILGSVSDGDNKPLGSGPILTFTGAGIHSVSFGSSNATVGFDNFSFGALAAVPEPAAWLTMILGFGAIGAAMRRRAQVAFA